MRWFSSPQYQRRRVGLEVALEKNLQSLDEAADGGLRVCDRGTARGQDEIRVFLRDGAQAADEVSGARGIPVVSAGLCLRNGVLQAVEIEEFVRRRR